MDALSLPCNSASGAPKLLFHTTFDGMTLNTAGTFAADSINPSRNFHTPFSDTSDSTTGYDLSADIKAIFGSATAVVMQSVPQNSILLADFGTYYGSTLTGGELRVQCTMRDSMASPNPQTHLHFLRTAAQALADDINELCLMLYVKIPAGLDLQSGNTTTGKFWEVWELKTGGYNNLTSIGDMRFKMEILGNNGYNEWVCTVDDNAGGNGTIYGMPASTQVIKRNFSGITAQLNTWTKCYSWWNRSKGRITMAIHPDGGAFQVIGDIYPADIQESYLAKNTLYGAADLPICRLFFGSNYTTANLPAPNAIKEMQIWDKPPIKLA